MKNNDFMVVWRQRMSKVAVTAVKHVVWCLFGYRVEDVSAGHCFRAKVVALFGVLVSSLLGSSVKKLPRLGTKHPTELGQQLANKNHKELQLHDANKQPAVTFSGETPLAVSLLGRNGYNSSKPSNLSWRPSLRIHTLSPSTSSHRHHAHGQPATRPNGAEFGCTPVRSRCLAVCWAGFFGQVDWKKPGVEIFFRWPKNSPKWGWRIFFSWTDGRHKPACFFSKYFNSELVEFCLVHWTNLFGNFPADGCEVPIKNWMKRWIFWLLPNA